MRTFCNYFILFATAAVILPSCNKDDVIEDPDRPVKNHFRPSTGQSSAFADRVYEWTPAPGQFINDTATGGMSGGIDTADKAAAWAQERLAAGLFVSLGGFGGYIVVGFDHSIAAADSGYDFAVIGNAFFNASTGSGGSNEPGIVYVMRDTDGNGRPDDTWYELRGSESGKAGTMRDYEVTYVRPSAPGMDVSWTDNRGNSGCVDYIGAFHKQDYYYPAWIAADSYTLRGTCLQSNNSIDTSTGYWDNPAYGWGYADNMGADNVKIGNFAQCNRFRIADAVDADGNPVELGHIDFVKVQTGVNAKSGILGEVSTEVLGIMDLNL